MHLAFGMGVLWALTLERPSKWPLVFFLAGVASVFRPTQMLVLPLVGILFLREAIGGRGIGDGPTPHPALSRKGRGGDPKGRWRVILLTLTAFALGRSTLLYLPLRSALEPPLAYADLTHPWPLVKHVLGLGFSGSLGTASLASVLRTLEGMAQRAWVDLTPVGAFLLLGGILLLFREAKRIPAFLWVGLAWAGMEALLVLSVPYPAFESHMALLGWCFAGWVALLPLAWIHSRAKGERARLTALACVLGLAVLLQLSGSADRLRERASRSAEDLARNILGTMGPSTLYLPAEENEYFPVVGLQQSMGLRKDVRAVMPGTKLEVFGPWVREALLQGRPVVVTREWEGLPDGWRYERKGPLLGLTRTPAFERVPGPVPAKAIASWGGIGITRVALEPPVAPPGGRVGVSLDWVRTRPGPQDEARWIVLVFTDAEGNFLVRDGVLWFHDIHRPFGGGFSFPKMPLGQVHREKGEIWIPSDYPPGEYRLMAALRKGDPSPRDARSLPSGSFYEGDRQAVGKFAGRVEGAALMHYMFESGSGPGEGGFWPVEGSTLRPHGAHFVPLTKLIILAPTH
jgi:hypothetical protein